MAHYAPYRETGYKRLSSPQGVVQHGSLQGARARARQHVGIRKQQ